MAGPDVGPGDWGPGLQIAPISRPSVGKHVWAAGCRCWQYHFHGAIWSEPRVIGMSPTQGLHSPWPQQRQCSVNHRNELSDLMMGPVPGVCGGVGMEGWRAALSPSQECQVSRLQEKRGAEPGPQ